MRTKNLNGIRFLAAAAVGTLLAACTLGAGHEQGKAMNGQLQAKLASLEQRKIRLEDLTAIKQLQSAYGYYLDQGLWDQASDLFADDGSIEYGLDGVYASKRRVREYLHALGLALGAGKSGLTPGQLNEHMLIMPVITLAADGQSARGTWRDIIMTGHLGKDAFWGEGPYENEYVKVNGTWKIRRIHWFQTLLVPYEGGWAKHDDVNGGKYVSASLAPDAPPTVNYRPWPGAFTPPFHFRTGKGQPTEPANGLHSTQSSTAVADGAHTNAASLARQTAQLAQDVQLLQDQNDIENLQQMYGYYLDKGQWEQAAALFSDSATLEIQGRGAYLGRPRVLEYLRAIGPEGPAEGRLFDNMQLQPLIHVAADGQSAKGRWRLFAQLAQYKQFHEWGVGVHENEYVKEGGQWKIAKLHLYPTLYTPYEKGWGKEWQAYSRFEPQLKPDRAGTAAEADAQHRSRAPFHYGNPVTSHTVARSKPGSVPDAASIESILRDVERHISRLEDVAEIKNLQATYGYYLATLEWDALTDKFARDGTIEIALRGVYVGKTAVRRNLNLYGQQGLDQGVLHNHMQFQPVIHVADDGMTAKIRSRAFSMMGNAGKAGTWMGGVYENDLVKEDGEWKFRKDQVMNTYFAPYDVGWKDLAPRPAPGITESNPPDRPPSFHFDMYPKSFLPPYHYPDPAP